MRVLTPPGRAGIAVYRFEAAERAAIAACLRAPSGGPLVLRADRPLRATLVLPGGAEDDVLVVALADGSIELHAHGAPALAAALERCVPATPPTVGPAAVRLLQAALGPTQLALALEQVAWDFDQELERIAGLPPAVRAATVAAAVARSRPAMALAQPLAVHLIGRQNVGKSTLFNRLVGHDRVLSGTLAGLTRDAVAEPLLLDGYPYVVWDHAGEGPAATAADAAAIARSRRQRADGMRILLVDAAAGPDAVDRDLAATADLVLASRADLVAAPWPDDVPCHGRCAPLGDDVAQLRALLGGLLRTHRGLPAASPVGGFAALDDGQFARLVGLGAA
ncbi:MAG: GTPase [Planctomycetota bacterium]